jgi:hypothetical protein
VCVLGNQTSRGGCEAGTCEKLSLLYDGRHFGDWINNGLLLNDKSPAKSFSRLHPVHVRVPVVGAGWPSSESVSKVVARPDGGLRRLHLNTLQH